MILYGRYFTASCWTWDTISFILIYSSLIFIWWMLWYQIAVVNIFLFFRRQRCCCEWENACVHANDFPENENERDETRKSESEMLERLFLFFFCSVCFGTGGKKQKIETKKSFISKWEKKNKKANLIYPHCYYTYASGSKLKLIIYTGRSTISFSPFNCRKFFAHKLNLQWKSFLFLFLLFSLAK